MPLLRFHNLQIVILFSFLLFVSIPSTLPSKEQKSVFSSQENGAQQIPRIRTGESTDEGQVSPQQNKNVKPPNLGASPEGQADEETNRLKNVAKDVEEKLGLDPPRGELIPSDRDNKNGDIGNALQRISGIRDEPPGAIDSGGGLSPLLALGGGAQQALAGGVGGVQPPVLLAALLRQQRQRQLQQLSSARGNTPGIGTNLATLQAIQRQRQQQDQQQLQQRRALQQQQQRQQQQQIQALLQQVALQQQLLAGRRAAGGDARLRGIGAAESSFRNNFEGSAAPSPSIFGPISGPTIPGPISVPPGLITSSTNTRRGTRISSGRSLSSPSSSGLLPSSAGAFSFLGFGDPNAALLSLLRNAQGASPSSIISPPIVAQQPFSTRVRSSPPSRTSDSLPSTLTFPDSAPPNSAPTVIRLVTDAAQQPQPQQPQRELQQILDQEQRILGVLERESRSNQLVESQRRELQTLQEQQQRILELLRAVTLRQDTVESGGDSVPNIRRRNTQQSKGSTKKAAEIATPQQSQSGGDNEILLRQLLQSLLSSSLISPQGPANTFPPTQQFVPTAGQIAQQNPFATSGGDQQAGNILRPIPAVAGQSQQLQPQQLQQFLDFSAQLPQQFQAVPGVGPPQQQTFDQDLGQVPSVQQFVTVLDPRTGQQFVASVGDAPGTANEGGGIAGEQTGQQQVGAVQRGRPRGTGRNEPQQIAGGLGGVGNIEDGAQQLLSQLVQRAQGRNADKISGNEEDEEEETGEQEEDEDEEDEA